jgi:hypothetical protein
MWWSLASAQVPADEVQERLKAAAGLPLTEALSLRAELDQRVRHGDDPAAVAAVDEANAAFVASLLDTGWPRSSVVGDPAAHQPGCWCSTRTPGPTSRSARWLSSVAWCR